MALFMGPSKEAHRAAVMIKQREKQREEIEKIKENMSKSLDAPNRVCEINNKFASHQDLVEEKIRNNTVGLVTLNEMKTRQEQIINEIERSISNESKYLQKFSKVDESVKKPVKRTNPSSISFALDEEEDDESYYIGSKKMVDHNVKSEDFVSLNIATKAIKMSKNPDVDTSFLPDKQREKDERMEKERLMYEFFDEQRRIKNEDLTVNYEYLDGSSHKKSITIKKAISIQHFLQKVLSELRGDFTELRRASVDEMMFIKEDSIIPHYFSFYDLIVNKANGKSGPLYVFDVIESRNLVVDSSIENVISHPAKVCFRSWYDKNKHIFPATRWELYGNQS